MLTGHELFRALTYEIEKVKNQNCIYCVEIDKPKHTYFECEELNAQDK